MRAGFLVLGAARRSCPPLHPEFLSLLRQRKKPKKGGPALRSPLAFGKGFPCLRPRQGSGRNSLHSLRSFRSNSLPGPVHEARCARTPALAANPAAQRGKHQTAKPGYPLAFCSQPLEVRYSAVGCWGAAPFAPPALAPRQGRAPQARHPSSSARLFDRSEQRERREFLAGPCLGVRAGNPQPQAGGERIRGLNFCLLLVQAKRRCGCRGAQPLRALSKSAQLLIQPRTSPCPNTTHL
jgi:hypothetical protein